MRSFLYIVAILAITTGLLARTVIVAGTGGDFNTIQSALNNAQPGDSILVKEKATPYFEKINFPSGGNQTGGYVTLMAYPGEHPVLDGSGVPNNPASYTDDMIYLENVDYVRIIGFEIRNDTTTEGSGIRVYGYGSYIEIRDNEIHNIRGGGEDGGAMGITIYGANDNLSINHIIIDGNHIYDCDPAWSEALTLNGNVEQFEVTNNIVEDVNNIGIDFIGGEDWLSSKFARNGRCAWNQVFRANSPYEGGYAAGIYVDGGQDIVIENNTVSGCDLGIEIGAENAGVVTSGIKVRNNVIYKNEKAGLVFGGYDVNTGRVKQCDFTGNTCYQNDVLKTGHGELWVQYAEDNNIADNIFYANDQSVLLYSEAGNVDNTLNFNLWYTEGGEANARYFWNGQLYIGFGNYQAATGQDSQSVFSDPEFVDAAHEDFHLNANSPAIDHGDPNYSPDSSEKDLDGDLRLIGTRVDIGADEVGATSLIAIKPGPRNFRLLCAYPNPFNPMTQIRYYLPHGQHIRIEIFDINGRVVRQLADSNQPAGTHSLVWNGKDDSGASCPSGVYFLRLISGLKIQTAKLVLVR